jgi:hypothetical protein
MRFNKLITRCAIATGLCVMTGAGSPGPDCPPPSPAVGYHERCAVALAPALGLRPVEPALSDSPLRRLMKLRAASAFRRLELAAQRVAHHQDAPGKLLPILEDVGESRLELCDDPSALIPVLEGPNPVLCHLAPGAKTLSVQVGFDSGGASHDVGQVPGGEAPSRTSRCQDPRQPVPPSD